MPISVEKLPGEPILLMTCTDPVDFMAELPVAYEQVYELAQSIQGPIYRITDFSQMKTTVGQLISVLTKASAAAKGSITDPEMVARTQPIIVGTGRWVEMGVNILNRRPNLDLQVFATVKEALEHIRAKERAA